MKDALGHGSNERGGGRKPIPGHPYHTKTNDQLRYIIKDASEAERATRGMSMYNPNSGKREDTAGKYSDQVNDAATVLAYRDRGGKSDAPSDQLASGPKSAAIPTHDSMSTPKQSDNIYARASTKGGRALGVYGPHPDRETAAKAAWAVHPSAKQVSTSRGQYGMDIQWHEKK